MDTHLLKKLGMNSKEIKLYLALLELGSSGANLLSRRINENRTSTYSLLQSMQKKGHIYYYTKANVKCYAPTDPQYLINHYCDGAKYLKNLLPELLAINNQIGHKPKITFYEGVQGIKQLSEILLEVPGSVRESFMGVDEKNIHPEIKQYFEEDFVNRRIKLGILYRGIVTGYMPMGSQYEKSSEGQLRELKYVNSRLFPIKIHIDIFPHNKVALYSYNKDEMMGVIIEHESFYITMKTVFQFAWAGVDVLNK